MIRVDPGAQQTDAFQESRNLLLSTDGPRRRDPRPRDRGRRRPLHPRRGGRPDRPRAALLPALARPRRRPRRSALIIEGFLEALVERAHEGPVREALRAELEQRPRAPAGRHVAG